MSIRATKFRFSDVDEEGDDENCEWVMLFCDLSIVVVLYKVSLALHTCSLSRDNFIAVFVLLFNVFSMRHSFEEYDNRLKQFPLRIIPYFVYGWGSFMMAMNAFAFKVSPASADCNYNQYSEITQCILDNSEATTLIDTCTNTYVGRNISQFCVSQSIKEINYYHSSVYSCSDSDVHYFRGFGIGYLICKLSIIYVLLIFYKLDRKNWFQLKLDLCRHTGAFIAIAVALMVEWFGSSHHSIVTIVKIYFFGLIFLIEVAIILINGGLLYYMHAEGRHKSVIFEETAYSVVIEDCYPLDSIRYQKRLGDFMMMVLGEMLFELAIVPFGENNALRYTDLSYFTYLLMFSFGVQYYEAVHAKVEHQHAIEHSFISGFMFIWIHPFLAYAVLLGEVGISVMSEAMIRDDTVKYEYNMTLCYGCAAFVVFSTIARITHAGIRSSLTFGYRYRWWFVGFHLLVLLDTKNNAFLYTNCIIYNSIIAFVLSMVDIYMANNFSKLRKMIHLLSNSISDPEERTFRDTEFSTKNMIFEHSPIASSGSLSGRGTGVGTVKGNVNNVSTNNVNGLTEKLNVITNA